MRIRQARSNALVVSCDDWVPSRNGDRLRWREKGQLDSYLDARTGFFDGPLLLANQLIAQHGLPPESSALRPKWRSTVFREIGLTRWAHVPLPLAVCSQYTHEPAQPAKPKNQELISVLIPSGGFFKPVNGRSTMLLRHCLTTLLQRSDYRNLEVVIVDGGEFTDAQLVEFKNLVNSTPSCLQMLSFPPLNGFIPIDLKLIRTENLNKDCEKIMKINLNESRNISPFTKEAKIAREDAIVKSIIENSHHQNDQLFFYG